MTTTKALLFLVLVLASVSWGAGYPQPQPPNNYKIWIVYPWELVQVQGYAYYRDNAGIAHPVPYTPFAWTSTELRYSGGHDHDTGVPGGNSSRNGPQVVLGALSGVTGLDGKTPPLLVRLNGFSGYTTIECNFAGVKKDGVNFFGKVSTYTSSSQLGTPTTGLGFTGFSLVPFSDNQGLFTPQSQNQDNQHKDSNGNPASFWVSTKSLLNFGQIGVQYNTFQNNRVPTPIYLDRVNYRRFSIPYGGWADNDYAGTLQEWRVRLNEGHAEGLEGDIGNPGIYEMGPTKGTDMEDLLSSVLTSGCRLGYYTESGSGPADVNYWRANAQWHVTCQPQAARLPGFQ